MNRTEFSKAIDALGLTQVGAARFLGVDPRTCRRYVAGELPLPPAAAMLLRVMLAHGLAPDDVGKLDGRPDPKSHSFGRPLHVGATPTAPQR
jgi:hypothetical protein